MRALCLLLLAGVAAADEWPRFRGPNGAGVSEEKSIPVTWAEKDFAWRVAVPGLGHSSPVIWGGRVFLTSAEKKSGRRMVLAHDLTTGKQLWRRDLDGGAKYKTHNANSFATSTPVVDAERLYTLWATPEEVVAVAFDHDGKQVWKTPLGEFKSQHGFGMSPLLHKGLLIAHLQPDGDGRVVGLDVKDGKPRWSLPRSGKNATYSTPCVRGDEVIFTNWHHGISAVDAAGKLRWEKAVFTTEIQQRSIASPVLAGDLVLGIAGFAPGEKRLVALRPGEKPLEVWRYETTVPQMSTPLVVGNRVFLATEKGFGVWLDAASGKEVWRNRLKGEFAASPLLIGGRIYCASTAGRMLVLEPKDTLTVIGESPIGEGTQATPAVAGGRLVVRTEGHLLCIAGKR